MMIKRQVMVYRPIGIKQKKVKVFNTSFDFNQFAFDTPGILVVARWELYENI